VDNAFDFIGVWPFSLPMYKTHEYKQVHCEYQKKKIIGKSFEPTVQIIAVGLFQWNPLSNLQCEEPMWWSLCIGKIAWSISLVEA
jgi:hypothetical protein